MKTFKLEKVQETMLLPLWGRYIESNKVNPFLYDAKAIEIINNIDYDISKLQNNLTEYNSFSWVVRAKTMDNIIMNFIEKHPKATIVNIGSGLDTTFERVDNGEITWYDLDLPDAIDFRKMFISECSRRKFIGKSVFDYSWIDEIEICDNVLFIAGGVLMFFEDEQLKELFSILANNFSGGEFFFDVVSRGGLKYTNDLLIKAGMKDATIAWGVDSPEEIVQWCNKVRVLEEFSYFQKIPRSSDFSAGLIKSIDMCDQSKGASFYHLKFI